MTENAWTDEALKTGRKDALGRLPYAQQAAELINATHSFESSTVFGLSGPWGSGKTSLVNMITEELEDKYPNWAIAKFTPWATNDVSGLLGEFYSSLASALPANKQQEIRKALAATASVAAPAGHLIPFAGGAAAAGIKNLAEYLKKSKPWQVAFEEASKQLRTLGLPILVVVDDIDRLHGDELMALLKVVRLLGRFDGVQYLLAYDDETLARSMKTPSEAVDRNDGSAERFMEKIVQYPLFVPPLLRSQQLSRLRSGLANVSRETTYDDASSDRLSGLIDCFTNLLKTPRAIDRYIAQLRHHIPLLPSAEVDDEDVKLLTLIRVSFPSLFNAIPQYRSELISGHTKQIRLGVQPLTYEPFNVNLLLKSVPEKHHETAIDLLISLFPKLPKEHRLSTYASRRRQSVQHEEYFDRYFAMSILNHDISDITVEAAVTGAINGYASQLIYLLAGTPEESRSLIISKCLSEENQPSTDQGRISLAETVAAVADQLPSDDTGPFTDQDQLLTWIGKLLTGLDRGAPSAAIRTSIWMLRSLPLRIRAWRRLEYNIEHAYRSGNPVWYEEVTEMLLDDSIADLLSHLKQGDSASESSGVGYQIEFILRHRPGQIRTAIHKLLEKKEIDLPILASRLVSAQTLVGAEPDWKLSADFNQETFNRLAPPGKDPWYDQLIEEVDLRDLSWANRRRFAAGRVTPPPSSEDKPTDDSLPKEVA